MRKILCIIVLVTAYFLVFSQETRAQEIYGHTDLYVIGGTIYGMAETSADYNVQLYYCLYVSGTLYQNDVAVAPGYQAQG